MDGIVLDRKADNVVGDSSHKFAEIHPIFVYHIIEPAIFNALSQMVY